MTSPSSHSAISYHVADSRHNLRAGDDGTEQNFTLLGVNRAVRTTTLGGNSTDSAVCLLPDKMALNGS